MKINWFSNAPWAKTGYGNQTNLFVPKIADDHEMSITAFYGLQGGIIMWQKGIPVFPVYRHNYGQDIWGAHARYVGADIIISLIDAWVMQPENLPKGMKWYPWFPVDCEPMPLEVSEAVRKAEKGITMSKFGQKQAELLGLDTYYVPHGIDTKTFKPADMTLARQQLGLPQDKFIVGMVAANKGLPPRKAFYQQIAAFAAFHKKHSDSILYLHTYDGVQGDDACDLPLFCTLMGLKSGYMQRRGVPVDATLDVVFVDQYSNILGLPNEYMVDVYNALDVMMLVSMGEGFGIPIVEAQSCGCPVIVGDWTSMSELCFSGWKVSKGEAIQSFNPMFNTFQWQTTEAAVFDRLEKAYQVKGNQDYRERARKGALAYDVDKVYNKYWKPVLADIEKGLK